VSSAEICKINLDARFQSIFFHFFQILLIKLLVSSRGMALSSRRGFIRARKATRSLVFLILEILITLTTSIRFKTLKKAPERLARNPVRHKSVYTLLWLLIFFYYSLALPGIQKLSISQKQQELLKQATEQQFQPKDPPPEFEFVADPPSISALDLDIVKLRAEKLSI
jgi:hypothetical protein